MSFTCLLLAGCLAFGKGDGGNPALAFSTDGKHLFVADDACFRRYDVPTLKPGEPLRTEGPKIDALAVSPDSPTAPPTPSKTTPTAPRIR